MSGYADDVDRIMAVMERAFDPRFGEAWSYRQVHDALTLGNCHYRLIDASGAVPGEGADAAGFWLSRHGCDEEELLLIAVAPEFRGTGLGEQLLDSFAAAARGRGVRRLLLEMRCDNPAGQLYRRFGFGEIGQRPAYYRTPDGSRLDAVTFAFDFK